MKASYVKTDLPSVINISKIVTIHYYEFDRNFVFDGETHNFWEMVYVDKGQVEIERDGEKIILSQGEIVFHQPNEFHSIRAHRSAPIFFVVSFVCHSPAMLYFEGFHTVLSQNLKPFLTSIVSEAEETFEIRKNNPHQKRLIKKEAAAIGGEQLIKTYLEQLLIFLIRHLTKKRESAVFPSKESMETYLVSAVKGYIAQRKNEVFRVNALCKELGYSKSYLSRLFREQTGETIASYAIYCKIKEAKRLICDGTCNFTQISEALAFDNPQYFSRVFKRVTGMTPTEFKLSLRV